MLISAERFYWYTTTQGLGLSIWTGYRDWPQELAIGTCCNDWPCGLAIGTGRGHWQWGLAKEMSADDV